MVFCHKKHKPSSSLQSAPHSLACPHRPEQMGRRGDGFPPSVGWADHLKARLSLAVVGSPPARQLQAAHREQRDTPKRAATAHSTHKTTNQLSPRGTQTLSGVCSRFIAALPETTKISAAMRAKGEEKPLRLPTSLGESGREQYQFGQRFLPWLSLGGEIGAPKG